MIWRRRSRSAAASAPLKAAIPEGFRVYAVGDIHGRSDLLDRMATLIGRDLAGHPGVQGLTIVLGDFIDRGPSSRAVIERLAAGPFPTSTLSLRGNHEDVLLRFLDDPSVLEYWRGFGGAETLFSYGVDVRRVLMGQGFEEAQAALRRNLPEEHRAFLEALRLSYTIGDYFLCHAGIRPGIALDRQAEEDLLWIRDEFLESPAFHGKVIVHGHTPREQPELRPNRINVDTGAYLTGRLTCLCLAGESRVLLQT